MWPESGLKICNHQGKHCPCVVHDWQQTKGKIQSRIACLVVASRHAMSSKLNHLCSHSWLTVIVYVNTLQTANNVKSEWMKRKWNSFFIILAENLICNLFSIYFVDFLRWNIDNRPTLTAFHFFLNKCQAWINSYAIYTYYLVLEQAI